MTKYIYSRLNMYYNYNLFRIAKHKLYKHRNEYIQIWDLAIIKNMWSSAHLWVSESGCSRGRTTAYTAHSWGGGHKLQSEHQHVYFYANSLRANMVWYQEAVASIRESGLKWQKLIGRSSPIWLQKLLRFWRRRRRMFSSLSEKCNKQEKMKDCSSVPPSWRYQSHPPHRCLSPETPPTPRLFIQSLLILKVPRVQIAPNVALHFLGDVSNNTSPSVKQIWWTVPELRHSRFLALQLNIK